ncbi:MAG: glycosyltransferase [Kiritimatiellia bacterium]|jgi:glycosyltransferase involved in cell wall biosynthesis|nr:glycosyltransferase [Kiritimatiellia bacterium]
MTTLAAWQASEQMHLSFQYSDSALWTAGLTYLNNVIRSLRALPGEEQPRISIFVGNETFPDSYAPIRDLLDDVIVVPDAGDLPRRSLSERAVRKAKKMVSPDKKAESLLSNWFSGQRVDVLFSRSDCGPGFRIPLLIWLPDFQHKRMPEMFTEEENRARDREYMTRAERATRIVVSSNDVKKDVADFAPRFEDRICVLPFVSYVPDSLYDRSPEWVCEHYDLPERFVFMPNQFWRHKNHEVVVDAVAALAGNHPEITVVCTGNTHDYRNPGYFSALLYRIAEKKVRNRFILLGMVPHSHLFSLMRQSLAVLQPSLFEGWNSCVEEVKSVGKGMIVSDIAVHREQNPPASRFFEPEKPEALAASLVDVFRECEPGPDKELETAAQEALPGRMIEFARRLLSVSAEIRTA